jgi:hypothetical protein
MLKENLKDAGEIIQNILNQHLAISNAKEDISLFLAAKQFDPQHPQNSDLRKILLTFLRYPEHTEILVQELELILKDL